MRNLMALGLLLSIWIPALAGPAAVPTHRIATNMGPGCKIAMTLPVGKVSELLNANGPGDGLGGFGVEPLPESWKSSSGKLSFGLSCKPADASSVVNGLATWNRKSGLWEKNLDNWFAPPQFTGKERKEIDRATRVLNIQSVNAKGYAGIYEEINGEENLRVRWLYFCVIHPPKAVCGYREAGMLRDGRKGDLTPHTLKILQGIEFLDDAPESVESGTLAAPNTSGIANQ